MLRAANTEVFIEVKLILDSLESLLMTILFTEISPTYLKPLLARITLECPTRSLRRELSRDYLGLFSLRVRVRASYEAACFCANFTLIHSFLQPEIRVNFQSRLTNYCNPRRSILDSPLIDSLSTIIFSHARI